MRAAVITDAQANLPALQAALHAIEGHGVDTIFHTGDAIGVGPFPAQTLDLLLNTPKMRFVMGDFDALFVDGLPEAAPPGMRADVFEHQQWTHAMLDPALRETMAAWPYLINSEAEGVPLAFMHYALAEDRRSFLPVVEEPEAGDLDELFAGVDAMVVFYGHVPQKSSLQGRAMYINPGSLGCQTSATANYCIFDIRSGNIVIDHHQVVYDDSSLLPAFEKRGVPGRIPFLQAFFGGRFGGR